MRLKKTLTALAAVAALGAALPATAVVMVGGEAMYPSRNIVENAVNSADHTTLVAAVQAADLMETLSSEGPFTVFAPVNAAFAALPDGTVETLLQPENKGTLQTVLTYHVVPGALTATELRNLIEANGGEAELTTAAGAKLTARMNGPANVVIEDAAGGTANIVTYNVMQSNGVIHSIDKVLLPQ